ncbi:MAG: ABC transporter permease, partial [Bacteroidetes bacterium]|nr:ABC transporter permease [Bacteroidota bacterium]
MLKNYLKIAFRSLLKYRLYSTINILGLAVALGTCILILLFIQDELSFDRFHTRADQIYRVHINEHYEGRDIPNTVGPFILGPTIHQSIPEVEHLSRISQVNSQVKKGDFFDQESVMMVEPDFFSMFDFPLLSGNQENPLSDLKTVVITPEIANKYFGDQNPVGQPLSFLLDAQYEDFVVTGVIEPAPANSSIQFDLLIPFENNNNLISDRARNNWYSVFVETYLVLKEGVSPKATEAKFPDMMKQALGDDYQPGGYEVGLQPLTDIHLNAEMPQGMVPVSDWRYTYILGGIALLILVVACINFMTLAVGRSLQRA